MSRGYAEVRTPDGAAIVPPGGGQWLVGCARAVITPPLGSELVGQFEPRFSERVHDDLYVRAMVISDGQTAVALTTCDVASLPAETVAAARAAVATTTGMPSHCCHILATHTHTGPSLHPSLGRTPDASVTAAFPDRVAAVVAEAHRRLAPARLMVATSSCPLTFNRRFLTRSGGAVTHPARGREDILGPEGPADPELHVLSAHTPGGRWIGALVNWASHPITVGHESVVSADYPGALEAAWQRAVGPDAICLFANGAAGNLCPFDWYHPEATPYGFPYMEHLGDVLATTALDALAAAAEPCPATGLRCATRHLAVPLRAADDAERTAGESWSAVEQRIFAQERELLDIQRRAAPTESLEIAVVSVGPLRIVLQPTELFCEFGMAIKTRAGRTRTLVAGYANGNVGYVPTETAFANGGYETRLCRTSKLAPEAGKMIVDSAVDMLGPS